MIINRIFKIPYFTFAYGVDVWNLNGLKLIGLKHSQGIVTISKYTKGVILEQLKNYSDDRIFMLYPTIVPERFKPGPKPEYLMKRWNINKDDKIILTVARLSKSEQYKGYDKVIIALSHLLNFPTSQLPNFKYILVGSGDDLPRIKSLIRELHLEDYVILPGFVSDDELPDYYNLCDVFVMPSKKEGFGIVFLEALAYGKPVIAGNKDGSRDALLDGKLGILIDPDNVDELAEAIINVLEGKVEPRLLDPDYLKVTVLEHFGFDKFSKRVEEILQSTSSKDN
jgi:glycosyltransferase involved in cell wall biosynthesis